MKGCLIGAAILLISVPITLWLFWEVFKDIFWSIF